MSLILQSIYRSLLALPATITRDGVTVLSHRLILKDEFSLYQSTTPTARGLNSVATVNMPQAGDRVEFDFGGVFAVLAVHPVASSVEYELTLDRISDTFAGGHLNKIYISRAAEDVTLLNVDPEQAGTPLRAVVRYEDTSDMAGGYGVMRRVLIARLPAASLPVAPVVGQTLTVLTGALAARSMKLYKVKPDYRAGQYVCLLESEDAL